jgi:hypothetical protein
MASDVVCPKCRHKIPLADINVATDIALCRSCGEKLKYSEIAFDHDAITRSLNNPPRGVWKKDYSASGFEVGASTRSAVAFFLVPFMCIWAGGSLGGIYGTQIWSGHFNRTMSLFGIPFILGTLLFGSITMLTVFGKIVVNVEGGNGVIFTGVGPIGWRRRFDWRGVTSIRRTQNRNQNGSWPQITLDGEKRLSFSAGVKAERQDYMLAFLQNKLREARIH